MDALLLARWQFGITTVYHFIFVPLTLGLAPLVAILQTFHYRTNNPVYGRLAQFFGRLLVINFTLGVVTGPQHVHVFNSTLRENVRLARSEASDHDVTEALDRAELVEFLNGLPQGLDTMLGEFGARMSAGERQRLGFARILLTDAPLVLVDEPTAHLDSVRAQRLLATLRQWASNRTMLLVSHRPDALNSLDRVLLVRGGHVTAWSPAAAHSSQPPR